MRSKRSYIIIILGLFFSTTLHSAEYKVAVRAHHGVESAIQQWGPTLEVLNSNINGHTFTLLPIIKLNDISQRAGRGEFDFLLTNPSSFVEVRYNYEAYPLVTLINKRANTAQTRFGSVIFTHAKNEEIISISDLKGKKLMAVSEPAFGGWRVGWLEMLSQNFNPYNDLGSLMFTKNGVQSEVVHSVRDGIADAGVVRTDLLERMEADGKIDMRYFRVINSNSVDGFPFFLSTPLYPEWAFCALKKTPTKLSKKVKKILRSISKDSEAAKAGKYVGWSEAKDYSPVESLMKTLKVGPFKEK